MRAGPGREQAYGVIVEFQGEGGLITVVGFASGDASIYRSAGRALIGGRRDVLVAASAQSLVAQAQTHVQLNDLAEGQGISDPGRRRGCTGSMC